MERIVRPVLADCLRIASVEHLIGLIQQRITLELTEALAVNARRLFDALTLFT